MHVGIKRTIEIGAWTLPHEKYDGIVANSGFIQEFVGIPLCADMPKNGMYIMYIKFLVTRTPRGGHGLIPMPYQQETRCKDLDHFKPTQMVDGWDITWGWK